MKLFVIAALVAVAAAGRLEHLERSYLPPHDSNGGFGNSNGGFGNSHGGFGNSHGSFGANSGASLHGHNARGNFAGATSNQYLLPNHGPSSNGGSQFAGSLQEFCAQQNYRSQQFSDHQAAPVQQYAATSSQFGSPQAGSSFSAPSHQQYPQQSAAANRQYLAPKTGSYQQHPQQAFDEQTGYHY